MIWVRSFARFEREDGRSLVISVEFFRELEKGRGDSVGRSIISWSNRCGHVNLEFFGRRKETRACIGQSIGALYNAET